MSTNTTPSGADALLQLIESYVEKRHTHGAPQYNVVTARARDAVLAAISAAQEAPTQAAQAVPQGWTLVPNDPTPEMLQIGKHAAPYRAADVYRAMIAAAPAAPQPAAPVHPRDDAVFELWWADHMPNASQADAWAEWCSLRANQPEPRPATQQGDLSADALDAKRWRAMRQTMIAVDFEPEMGGSPVVMFELHAKTVRAGPEGADEIADAAIAKAEGTTP